MCVGRHPAACGASKWLESASMSRSYCTDKDMGGRSEAFWLELAYEKLCNHHRHTFASSLRHYAQHMRTDFGRSTTFASRVAVVIILFEVCITSKSMV